jgi:SPP1 gp7 family putative phage head morphogenesis protein
MSPGIEAFDKAFRPALESALLDVMGASGKVAAKALKAINVLKAAAFDPEQPRDKDGKFAPNGGGDGNTEETTQADLDKKFPVAGATVDGREVTDEIDNMSSISASLTDYEILDGVREVKISDFEDNGKPSFYSTTEEERVKELAAEIKDSNTISPLIVVYDGDKRGPYVLEGGHRFDALKMLKAKSLPALVVIDTEKVKIKNLRAAAPAIKGKPFKFDATSPDALAWAKAHAGETIDDMNASTVEDIRNLVADAFEQQFDVDELADKIADLIGDDERAEMVARTESMRAANEGQMQAWDQATEAGVLTGDEKKEWIVTPDDRLCPICEPLDGEQTGLDDTFKVDGDEIDGPPAHPRCRCTIALAP